ncbi:hypothetical protein K435DRAFT_875772 [Dendrothele bispora CBS 962.96]|uniref:Uncharacterized protein n=1 Tax=Dendrothele bispora (strain CBS 962.96) TaxID=1314807 RepID=A0A4S8KTK5_DENBC|nr:hypothetical protein K435DRAFT_875772 [Dendrothele bispora CBS 962.96]
MDLTSNPGFYAMNEDERENWKESNIHRFHQCPEYCRLNLSIDSARDLKVRSPTELLQDSAFLDLSEDSLDQEILDLAGLSNNNISDSERENSMFDDSNDVKMFKEQAKIDAHFEDGPKAWATKVDIVKISTIEDAVNKGETYLFMNEISIDDEFMGYLAAIRDGNPVMGNNPLVEVYFSVFVDDWAKKGIYLLPFGAFQPILNVAEKGEADRNTLLFLFEEAYKDLLRTSRANLPSSQNDFDTLRMIAVPAMHFETPILLVADFKSKILYVFDSTCDNTSQQLSWRDSKYCVTIRAFKSWLLHQIWHFSQKNFDFTNELLRWKEWDIQCCPKGQPVTSNKDNVGLYMIGTILLLLHNPDISLSELRDCVEIPDTIPVIRGSMLEQISTVISKAELQNQTQSLRRSKRVAGQNNENQSLKTRYDEETLQWNSLGKSKWAYAPSSQ